MEVPAVLQALDFAKMENLTLLSMQSLQFHGNLILQIWAFHEFHKIELLEIFEEYIHHK